MNLSSSSSWILVTLVIVLLTEVQWKLSSYIVHCCVLHVAVHDISYSSHSHLCILSQLVIVFCFVPSGYVYVYGYYRVKHNIWLVKYILIITWAEVIIVNTAVTSTLRIWSWWFSHCKCSSSIAGPCNAILPLFAEGILFKIHGMK